MMYRSQRAIHSTFFLVIIYMLFQSLNAARADGLGGSIKGQLKRQSCADSQAVVWLSQGSLLLYQVDVPLGGEFEFFVLPGKYDLVATTSSGCFTEKQVHAQAQKTQKVVLPMQALQSAGRGQGQGK